MKTITLTTKEIAVIYCALDFLSRYQKENAPESSREAMIKFNNEIIKKLSI